MHAGHVDGLIRQQEDAHTDVALRLCRGTADVGGAGKGAGQAFLHLRLFTEERPRGRDSTIATASHRVFHPGFQ